MPLTPAEAEETQRRAGTLRDIHIMVHVNTISKDSRKLSVNRQMSIMVEHQLWNEKTSPEGYSDLETLANRVLNAMIQLKLGSQVELGIYSCFIHSAPELESNVDQTISEVKMKNAEKV